MLGTPPQIQSKSNGEIHSQLQSNSNEGPRFESPKANNSSQIPMVKYIGGSRFTYSCGSRYKYTTASRSKYATSPVTFQWGDVDPQL